MPDNERIYEILVIDDNEADAQFIKHAWSECSDLQTNVTILKNSRDALPYIRGASGFRNTTKPDLVMLDYRHPLNGGLALSDIKGDPDYMHLPIIVLSGSSNPKDYFEAYQRHANVCFRKPIDVQEYIDLVCLVGDTYLKRAVLPRR